jgi:hypothetical protein
MKMRKSILSLAVSLGAVSLLFAGNVFAEEGVPPSASVESDSIDPQFHVGTCRGNRASYATQSVSTTTTSTAFINIPSTSVSFIVPGALNICIIVDYAAQAFAPGGASGLMIVRAVRDGVEVGQPPDWQMVGGNAGPYSNSHSMQSVFPNVAPGLHTITMQFRSFFGTSVTINKGNMTVHHK